MLPLDPITVLLSIVICIFLATVLYKKQNEHPNYPPGPKPLPIIGNIFNLNVQKPHLSFQELAKKYGPVFSIKIGVEKIVVLCGYDIVKEALVNHADEFSGRPCTPAFMDATRGYGIVISNGNNWKTMRQFTVSTLRDFGMGKRSLEEKINEESNCLVETFKCYKEPFHPPYHGLHHPIFTSFTCKDFEKWNREIFTMQYRSYCRSHETFLQGYGTQYAEPISYPGHQKEFQSEPFDNTMIMNAAVANIIVSILLGHRFDYNDPKLQRTITIINDNVRIVGSPMALLYNAFPSLMRWIPGSHQSIREYTDELHSFIREIFMDQRDRLDINDQRSLIDCFLVRQKQEKPNPERYFHDENLITLILDLFSAGMETTASTLRWSLLLMMKYPEVQKNVQKEIEKVIGLAEPRMAHRQQMPYTDAVIHEIQRFSDVLPNNVPRLTTQDVILKGCFIPKGTHIIPSLTSVLRDAKYFKKPDEFYPQHFLDADGNFVKIEAFMPFSAGKRRCPGADMAKIELFLFFTKLLQNFTFKAPPGAKLDLNAAVGFIAVPQKHEICAISRN